MVCIFSFFSIIASPIHKSVIMIKAKFATLTPQDPKCQITSHIVCSVALPDIELHKFVNDVTSEEIEEDNNISHGT